MRFVIKETGETKKLKLFKAGSKKNIAKKLIRKYGGKYIGYELVDYRIDTTAPRTLSKAEFKEWADIMAVAQENLETKAAYLEHKDNYIHEVIESEIDSIYAYHCRERRDITFDLKNAVDAENAMWQRLRFGKVTSKTETLTFTHYRHTHVDGTCTWLMQIHCDFVMNMPNPKETFVFRDGVQFHFTKRGMTAPIVQVDDEEWFRPISASASQEDFMRNVMRDAVDRRFKAEGHDLKVLWAFE